jgi:hypothetical protein
MQTVSQEHLPLQANGYHCTSEMLYAVETLYGAVMTIPMPLLSMKS